MSYSEFIKQLSSLGMIGMMITRDGKEELKYPAQPGRVRPIHSAAKSIVSLAASFAVSERIIELDERLLDVFKNELSAEGVASGSDFEYIRNARLRHLLTMSLGQSKQFLNGWQRPYLIGKNWIRECMAIDFLHEPGTSFLYSDVCPYLLGKVIQKRSGMNLTAYLMPRLFDPLEINYPTWELDPSGDVISCGGLYLTLKDFHKLGLLCLNKGMYYGKRLVDEKWMDEALSAHISTDIRGTSYGYYFWLNDMCAYMYGLGGQYNMMSFGKNCCITVMSDENGKEKEILDILMSLLASV